MLLGPLGITNLNVDWPQGHGARRVSEDQRQNRNQRQEAVKSDDNRHAAQKILCHRYAPCFDHASVLSSLWSLNSAWSIGIGH